MMQLPYSHTVRLLLRVLSGSLILFISLVSLSSRADYGQAQDIHEISTDYEGAASAPGFSDHLRAFWFYDGGDVCKQLGVRQPDQSLSEDAFINATVIVLPVCVGTGLAGLMDGEVVMDMFHGEASLRELAQSIANSLKEFGNALLTLSESHRDVITVRLFLPTGIFPMQLQGYPVQLHPPEPALTMDSIFQEKILQFYLFNAFSSLVQTGYQMSYGGRRRKARDMVWPGFMLLAVVHVSRGGSSYNVRCLVKTTAILFGAAATASVFQPDTRLMEVVYEVMQEVTSVAIVSATSPAAMATAAGTKITIGVLYGNCQGTINSLMPVIYLFLPLSAQHYAGRNIPFLSIRPVTAMKAIYLITDAARKARNGQWSYLIPIIFLINVLNRTPGYNIIGTCLLLTVPMGSYLYRHWFTE